MESPVPGVGRCTAYGRQLLALTITGRVNERRQASTHLTRRLASWGFLPPIRCSMVNGMATKKITITLSEEQVGAIRALVDEHRARSVSGFVQHAVGVSLDDITGWGAKLALALEETGGPLTDEERAWADDILGVAHDEGTSAA